MYREVINQAELTAQIKKKLSVFDKVGIASHDRFDDIVLEHHPGKLLKNFKSVIVYAQGKKNSEADDMGGFSNYLEVISAQSDVMNYLETLGYKSRIVDIPDKDVSLVRMGMEAGVGEISPVDSLVVKGFGLTATLGAIVTEAPLDADEKVTGICIKCNKCLNVCPIREIANAKGDLSKCGCGKCRNICPV